ncbi:hypothetical protein NMY22_g19002 [Coprinellus aureogranulatus]|nr:hypothetical protein NMY22_g19002 [Coprinellus aureogranulatus]
MVHPAQSCLQVILISPSARTRPFLSSNHSRCVCYRRLGRLDTAQVFLREPGSALGEIYDALIDVESDDRHRLRCRGKADSLPLSGCQGGRETAKRAFLVHEAGESVLVSLETIYNSYPLQNLLEPRYRCLLSHGVRWLRSSGFDTGRDKDDGCRQSILILIDNCQQTEKGDASRRVDVVLLDLLPLHPPRFKSTCVVQIVAEPLHPVSARLYILVIMLTRSFFQSRHQRSERKMPPFLPLPTDFSPATQVILTAFNTSKSTIAQDYLALDNRILELLAEVQAVRSYRNALAFPNRLPVEVICQIFIACRDQDALKEDPREQLAWMAVMHVCRYWREIAIAHPPLWSNIAFVYGPEFTRLMLARSRNVPLVVRVRFPKVGMEDILREVLSQARRLRIVSLESEALGLCRALDDLGEDTPLALEEFEAW